MDEKPYRQKKGQKRPQSFRLSDEMRERLNVCAARTKQEVTQIANMAIEAAVEAIEANDYRLVVPIEFEVKRVPATLRVDEQQPKRKTA